MSQIICQNLALGYEGHTVSKNISFHVEQGDYFCIVGSNGSGKSTLVKVLLGLKAPDAGEISMGEGLTRRDVGYLPQQTEAQKDFPASVREIVLSGFAAKGGLSPFTGKAMKSEALTYMEQMGVDGLAGRSFRELSGGQQQRVLLARALCAADRLLLMDEPVAGLDPVATEEMYELIAHLNRSHGITVLMVTHDISAVLRYATKVLHMGAEPTFFEDVESYRRSGAFPGGEKEGEKK